MRAIWKGAVSFGLVSISIKLYSATEEKSIRFRQVHAEDGGRIRYQRVCSVCGKEVPYDQIAKGYELGGDETVVLTDDDFADLPLSTSHAIDVLEFVPSDQVDPILYGKSYYLEPDGAATKPYVLLRDALVDSERVAIVKIALRQREQLATLRVRNDILVMHTMLWPDEVRTPSFEFLDDDITVRSQELSMATSLIDSMTADFDPEEYTDDYREALQEVIDAKVAGREVVQAAEPSEEPSNTIDLMAALRASVDRARTRRGESESAPRAQKATAGKSTGGKAKSAAKTTGKTAKAAKKAAPAKRAAKKTGSTTKRKSA
ncbi:MAG: Ku protein [Actinocatenispora sp.]